MDSCKFIFRMPKAELDEMENLAWEDLLELAKRKYPKSILEHLDEISMFQMGHKEMMLAMIHMRSGEIQPFEELLQPMFLQEETQAHFESMPYFLVNKKALAVLAAIYLERIKRQRVDSYIQDTSRSLAIVKLLEHMDWNRDVLLYTYW